jgi:hypothetical protein
MLVVTAMLEELVALDLMIEEATLDVVNFEAADVVAGTLDAVVLEAT